MKRKVIIGVDVSKSSLDYAQISPSFTIPTLKDQPVLTVDNDLESIHMLLSSYPVGEAFFVLEPTGTYSDKLQCLLVEYGHAFSLVNPRQSHHFCEFLGISSKHDAQAARTLAYMGATQDLAVFKAPAEHIKRRKILLSALNGILKIERATQNRIHGLEQYKDPCSDSLASLGRILQTVSDER